jgi:hypothetical protein
MESGDGSIVIASITSCTNTSNPYVMIGAGLVARKARAGADRKPWVKTSLAPGSQVVSAYLEAAGCRKISTSHRLQPRGLWLHHLHRQLRPAAEGSSKGHQRQRPGRRPRSCRATATSRAGSARCARQLPRLAAAGGGLCAGRRHEHRPHHRAARPGQGRQGRLPQGHLADAGRDRGTGRGDRHARGVPGEIRRRLQGRREVAGRRGDHRRGLRLARGLHLRAEPALFPGHGGGARHDLEHRGREGAGDAGRHGHHRPHLPAGSFKEPRPPASTCGTAGAGARVQLLRLAPRQPRGHDARHLRQHPHQERDARRGRGRLHQRPRRQQMPIFDAAMAYQEEGTPLVVFGGEQYGAGSSRDWAAKGTAFWASRP